MPKDLYEIFASLLLVIVNCILVISGASAAVTNGSAQFQAKLYSEALGRIPDQGGWNSAMGYLAGTNCNAASLTAQSMGVLTSQEFLSSNPNDGEKVFKLIRATLHRDSYAGEFEAILQSVKRGASWSSVVMGVLQSNEFLRRADANCSNSTYGWQNIPPYNVVQTSTGSFKGGSGAELQVILNKTPYGGRVNLEQGATVLLGESLIIPSGVTLATVGEPGKAHAGLLGRLARNGNFNSALIKLEANSTLKSVWIDGQRNRFGSQTGAINLESIGSNIVIFNNLITDSPGWTNSQYYGSGEGAPCANGVIASNLVTAYGSSHIIQGQWTDGLSIACEDVLVENNEIIDATDVSIVVFRATPAVQKTVVRNNRALNSGNSAFGGYRIH